MDTPERFPENGTKVITHEELGDTAGMCIVQERLDARKPNAAGIYRGFVGGHGGDVWWVEHGDGSVGAYCYTELEFVKD